MMNFGFKTMIFHGWLHSLPASKVSENDAARLPKSIIFNKTFIIFNTKFIIFNTKSIILNAKLINCNAKNPSF